MGGPDLAQSTAPHVKPKGWNFCCTCADTLHMPKTPVGAAARGTCLGRCSVGIRRGTGPRPHARVAGPQGGQPPENWPLCAVGGGDRAADQLGVQGGPPPAGDPWGASWAPPTPARPPPARLSVTRLCLQNAPGGARVHSLVPGSAFILPATRSSQTRFCGSLVAKRTGGTCWLPRSSGAGRGAPNGKQTHQGPSRFLSPPATCGPGGFPFLPPRAAGGSASVPPSNACTLPPRACARPGPVIISVLVKCVEVSTVLWKSDSPSLKGYGKAPEAAAPGGASALLPPPPSPRLPTAGLGQSGGVRPRLPGPWHPQAAEPAPPGFWNQTGVGRLCQGTCRSAPRGAAGEGP